MPLNTDPNISQRFNSDSARRLSNIHQSGLDGGNHLSPFVQSLNGASSNDNRYELTNRIGFNDLSKYKVTEGHKMSKIFDLNSDRDSNSNSPLNKQEFEQPQKYGVVEGWETSTSAPDYANNTYKAAREVVLSSQPLVLNDFVGDGDQKDYYTFNVTSSTNLSLALSGLSTNADLELFNSRGRAISSSKNLGSASESITQNNLQAGRYYVLVNQGVKSDNTNYSLSFSTKLVSDAASNIPSIGVPQPTAPEPIQTSPSVNSFTQQVLDLTNTERTKAGLQPLRLNQKLNQSAQAHSQDMALGDYFSHTGANGSNAGDRAASAGYKYSSLGENIAAGYITAQEVVQAWMKSPGHRANIMNASYQELGVGYYYLANDTGSINYNYYWAQEFGRAG